MSAQRTPPAPYLPAFDALRFIAAAIVAIFHGEMVKRYYGIAILPYFEHVAKSGHKAVTFFFVLSGFLITWLLLRERESKGTVNVPAFYLRRILRIWPLYYLVMALGLWVIPHLPYLIFIPLNYSVYNFVMGWREYLCYLTFLPNVPKIGLLVVSGLVGHTWSIGLEEQFYAIWPWVIKRARAWVVGTLVVISLFLLGRAYIQFAGLANQVPGRVLGAFKIDAMLYGALAGALYHYGRIPAWVQTRPVLWALGLAALILTVFFDVMDEPLAMPVLAVVYALLLLSVATQPQATAGLARPWLRRLGQASYGIYMYNMLVIPIAVTILTHLEVRAGLVRNSPLWNVLYYTFYLSLNLSAALLSYRYLEQPFLRLKERFN